MWEEQIGQWRCSDRDTDGKQDKFRSRLYDSPDLKVEPR